MQREVHRRAAERIAQRREGRAEGVFVPLDVDLDGRRPLAGAGGDLGGGDGGDVHRLAQVHAEGAGRRGAEPKATAVERRTSAVGVQRGGQDGRLEAVAREVLLQRGAGGGGPAPAR